MDRSGTEPTVRFDVDVSRARWLWMRLAPAFAAAFFLLAGAALAALLQGVHTSVAALRDEGWIALWRVGFALCLSLGVAALWVRPRRRFQCEIGPTVIVASDGAHRWEIRPSDVRARRRHGMLVELFTAPRPMLVDLARVEPDQRSAVRAMLARFGVDFSSPGFRLFSVALFTVVGATSLGPRSSTSPETEFGPASRPAIGPVRRDVLYETREQDAWRRLIGDDDDLADTVQRCRWFTFHGRVGEPEFEAAQAHGFTPYGCRARNCRYTARDRGAVQAGLLEMSRHRRIVRVECHVDRDPTAERGAE